MRAVLTTSVVVGLISTASARPRPIVWEDRVVHAGPGEPHAAISKTLYLNDCRPNGCNLTPGTDDSRTNVSSIPNSAVRISPWGHGPAVWTELVQCVRETFAPFDIDVVTTDPGMANHFEVMVGGRANELRPSLVAGGVAPFINCDQTKDNVISFVFAADTPSIDYLCAVAAQEAAHVWGLDHELHRLDPMTYIELGENRKSFQNVDAQCGEELGQPHACKCGGQTQNSYAHLMNVFGPSPPPELAITTPADGQWVRPGFSIAAELASPFAMTASTLSIDGNRSATSPTGMFTAPTALKGGEHMLTVAATDAGGRMAEHTITVKAIAACAADKPCASGFHCLGGLCLPGQDASGGLGATCSADDACASNACTAQDGDRRCTAACEAGSCPGGYHCVGDGAAGVCWPDDTGGCSTGGGAGLPLGMLLVTLGVVRRRRSSAA